MTRKRLEREVLINSVAKQLLTLSRGDCKEGEKVGREMAARYGLTPLEFTRAKLLVEDKLTERIVSQVTEPGTPLETMARAVFEVASVPNKVGILGDFLMGKNKVKK